MINVAWVLALISSSAVKRSTAKGELTNKNNLWKKKIRSSKYRSLSHEYNQQYGNLQRHDRSVFPSHWACVVRHDLYSRLSFYAWVIYLLKVDKELN